MVSKEEYQILQEQAERGINLVFFKTYSISIPHVAYMEERVENIQETPEFPKMSEEEIIKAKIKLQEIRKELKRKLLN